MRRLLLRTTVLAVSLASGPGACAPEAKQATQVMLEVDAEPTVRARMATLTIDIRGGAANDAYANYVVEPETELEAPALPIKIALVPRGGDATRRYQVTVRARATDGSFVAEARVISGYIPNSIRFARLVLEDACIDVDQCVGSNTEPLTCRGGACADPGADVRDFSPNRDMPSPIKPHSPDDESDAGDGQDDAGGTLSDDAGSSSDAGGSSDAGTGQGTCKLGSSKLSCRLGT